MARFEKTVFISYRRTSFPWALAISQSLTHNGFNVFLDYERLGSGDFERIILDNIRARAHFIALLTPTTLERCSEPDDLMRREIEEAMRHKRNIVPIFLDGFDFGSPSIKPYLVDSLATLKRYNGMTVSAEHFAKTMEKLRGVFLKVKLEAVIHPASVVAEAAAREQQLEATRDALTGLLNRREFQGQLERALTRVKEDEDAYSLCYLDLDDFKSINDTFGHSAGDRFLVEISRLIKSKLRDEDSLSRMGGDEFGILFKSSLKEAMRTAETVREAVAKHSFSWEGHTLSRGVSIGVVEISANIADIHSAMADADSACYAAKKAGRNQVFGSQQEEEDAHLARRKRDMQWAARTNTALEDGRFVLFRQQIVPLQTMEAGNYFELLVRMLDEEGNFILPTIFLPGAERYGFAPRIDRWVIDNAFTWLASESEERKNLAMCSINLSGQSLADGEFLPHVIEQFRRFGIDGTKVCFEINEPAAIAEFAKATQFIQTLKGLGCRFAIDDFGTGLASFGYLRHFSVDFLKIDGSFVTELLRDSMDREMVRSINEIAHLTGKQTIAEIAENVEIVDMLRSLGVDYAQGYGVAMPERVHLPVATGKRS
jgi:diguanylate cyclase (GGDEF)-like protein